MGSFPNVSYHGLKEGDLLLLSLQRELSPWVLVIFHSPQQLTPVRQVPTKVPGFLGFHFPGSPAAAPAPGGHGGGRVAQAGSRETQAGWLPALFSFGLRPQSALKPLFAHLWDGNTPSVVTRMKGHGAQPGAPCDKSRTGARSCGHPEPVWT